MPMIKQLSKLLLISILLVTHSFVVSANNKPMISVFSINTPKLKLKYSEIMKNSVFHALIQRNFLTQDGNKIYHKYVYSFKRKADKSKFHSIQEVVTNSLFKDKIDSELIVFLKLNLIEMNKNFLIVDMGAEVYNIAANNFLTSWSIPKKKIIFPTSCDEICKNLKMSSNIVLMSNQLGESLGNVLKLNFRENDNNKSFVKKYKFNISGLSTNEMLSFTDIIVNEFPGFVKLINKEHHGSQHKWIYYSNANNLKLKKWLNIALKQLDLEVGEKVDLNISNNFVVINKYPKTFSSGSKGNPKKFN